MKREAIMFQEKLKNENGYKLPSSCKDKLMELYNNGRKTQAIPIKHVLGMIHNGDIVGYEQNRGSGKASKCTIGAVKDNYNVNAIGCIMFGIFGNKFKVGEGHGRLSGICERYNEGLFSEEELNDSIAIRLVSQKDFLVAYQDYNTQQKHTVNNCLSNQELVFGEAMLEIFKIAEVKRPGITNEMDKGKNYPIFSNILLALHLETTKSKIFTHFGDVYQNRRNTASLANKRSCDYPLSITCIQKERFVNGLIHYYDYMEVMKKMEKEKGVQVVKLFRAAGWMGTIICDKLFSSKNPMFHKNHSNLAEACYKHAIDVKPYISEITRVSGIEINRLMRDIDGILRARIVSKR